MMSSDEVSTDTFTQNPWPPPPVVILGDSLVDEADAPLVQHLAILVLRVDDHEAGLVVGEMALDQRERAFADRAEADHHDRPVDAGMYWPFGHRQRLPPGLGHIRDRARTE
jgi:hypothetical protein